MNTRMHLIALGTTLVLAGCGGGGGDTATLRVVGDSLNDSGTFGIKFTVQGSSTASTQIWIDHVARNLGARTVCPRYASSNGVSVDLNPTATQCANYAVGGGRINPSGTSQDDTPRSIVRQLQDASADGRYDAKELLFVDGGGNDAADLVGTYLAAGSDGGASYVALLSELLTSQQVNAAVAGGPSGLAQAGVLYMTALADRLADAVTTHALGGGAQRVLVFTAPDVTQTPRFLAVLAGVATQTDPATAEAVRTLARGWVQAFNTQLNNRFSGNTRVAMVDFHTRLNQWLSNPSAHGLTNTSTPACPITGTSGGLPTYTIATCSATTLSANPPGGTSDPNWWQSYVFSDDFHGTPRTNQLMGDLVNDVLASRSWD